MKKLTTIIGLILFSTQAHAACTDEEAEKIVELKRIEQQKAATDEAIAAYQARKSQLEERKAKLEADR